MTSSSCKSLTAHPLIPRCGVVAFDSAASNLLPDDRNQVNDIVVVELASRPRITQPPQASRLLPGSPIAIALRTAS
jgi:hypothetical protein